MSYLRVKTIKGRQYLYRQTSVRERKKVRTISEYLGCVSSVTQGRANTKEKKKRREYQEHYNREMRTVARDEARFAKWLRKTYGETGEERAKRVADEAKFSQERFLNETETAKGANHESRQAETGTSHGNSGDTCE
jgi:hypothetical protein